MDPINNQNPVASGSQMPVSGSPERKPIGPIAGAIIVIALLVLGGLYFWGAQMDMQTEETPYIPGDAMPGSEMPVGELESDTSAGLPAQGSSDDVSSIESDFNAMNMNQMESQNNAELNNI